MLPLLGEYLYAGKKFNSKKETVLGEDYLGIRVFRFYMKCTQCRSQFTIKTDPKNADYASEWGCTRNFERWKDESTLREEAKAAQEKDEQGDAMKALENRTKQSKKEMDILENLDELRAINARNSRLTIDEILEKKQQAAASAAGGAADALPTEDENAVREAFHAARREALLKQQQQLQQLQLQPAKRAADGTDKDDDDDDGDDGDGDDDNAGTTVDTNDDDDDELAKFEKLVSAKRAKATAQAASTSTVTQSSTTATSTQQQPSIPQPLQRDLLPVVASKVAQPAKSTAIGFLAGYGDDDEE